tara:strand:- start:420 stop:668 length:249 start_codon:yes stop_codon:yes gene_type:complete
MDRVGTALIKFTNAEIDLLINSIDFMTSLNIPIEKEWIKPYSKLKEDLLDVNNKLGEKMKEISLNINNELKNIPSSREDCED